MNIRYLIAGAALATMSSAAFACAECDADYMAYLAQQAEEIAERQGSSPEEQVASAEQTALDEQARQQAFQEYEAKKMAEAKAAFLEKHGLKVEMANR